MSRAVGFQEDLLSYAECWCQFTRMALSAHFAQPKGRSREAVSASLNS